MAKNFPKLTPRGNKGYYYFRTFENGKDKWINTRTDDITEARAYRKKILGSKESMQALSLIEKDSRKLSDMYVKSITGKDETSILLDEAFCKWTSTQPRYKRISEGRRNIHSSRFAAFVDWCKNKNLEYVEQVTNEVALQYASYLSTENYAASTYNEIIAHLSNIFDTLDKVFRTSNRNPFDKRIVPRISASDKEVAEHKALEPEQLQNVMNKAVEAGQGILDLFIIGSQTGMRLKDAALLKWKSLDKSFINIKASKTGVDARPPITKHLKEMFERRQELNPDSIYVLPEIAEIYNRDSSTVAKLCKKVFESALGKDMTIIEAGEGRKVNTAVYSFHSFRSTFMSLLAMRDVSIRDAMRILGWNTPTMVQKYERMLEAARGDSDRRTFELVNEISQLNYDIPDAPVPFEPTPQSLSFLMSKYSNVAIGKIYGLSDVAIGQRIKIWGLKRAKKVFSPDLSDQQLETIRLELKNKFH